MDQQGCSQNVSSENDSAAWIINMKLVVKLQGIQDRSVWCQREVVWNGWGNHQKVETIEEHQKDTYIEGVFREYSKLGRLKWVEKWLNDYVS